MDNRIEMQTWSYRIYLTIANYKEKIAEKEVKTTSFWKSKTSACENWKSKIICMATAIFRRRLNDSIYAEKWIR